MEEYLELADKITRMVFDQWGNKALAELRMEAGAEETGLKYYSIREDGGRRLVLVVCIVEPDFISRMSVDPSLETEHPSQDWLTYTLADFVYDALKRSLVSFQVARNDQGKITAFAICAIKPEAIRAFEVSLKLPT